MDHLEAYFKIYFIFFFILIIFKFSFPQYLVDYQDVILIQMIAIDFFLFHSFQKRCKIITSTDLYLFVLIWY